MSSRSSTSSAEVMSSCVFVESSNLLYNEGDLWATNLVLSSSQPQRHIQRSSLKGYPEAQIWWMINCLARLDNE